MYQRLIWPISITFGVCVALLVLWVTASLIEAEPSNLQDQTERSSVQLIGTRGQCTTKTTELHRAISNSRSCQIDEDCALIMDSARTFNQCFISVQRSKVELVSVKLAEFKTNCRDLSLSICGHLGGAATCRGNICTAEDLPRISLEKLVDETMTSLNEDL